MKNITPLLIAFALILSLAACNQKTGPTYTVDGTVTGMDTGWVLLKKREEGNWVTKDSVQMKDGAFHFQGTIDLPEMHYLSLLDKEGYLPLFLENAQIKVRMYPDSLEKSSVTGSASHDLYKTYLDKEEMYNIKLEELYNQYVEARQSNDSVKALSMEGSFDAIQKDKTKAMKEFIMANGKSSVSAYLALSNAYSFELPELKEINKALDPGIAGSSYVKKLKEREETLIKVQPGNLAPDFTLNDTTGKPVSLSSFHGKYVLIDFWASWCGPCRAENPNVVAAFQKYQSKGFTILGVSLDQNHDKWLEAIAKDNLTWTHISELTGWDCSAAQLYGVMSIPANFLIDKEGKILGNGLRGEDLIKKLDEVFSAEETTKE